MSAALEEEGLMADAAGLMPHVPLSSMQFVSAQPGQSRHHAGG